MQEFRRGDIVLVENPLQESHGHVMAGNHFAVVIQNEKGNTHSGNLIVAYLSSQLKRLEMGTHVVLQWYSGLRKTSVVQAEQIATVAKEDILSIVDHLTDEDMKRVDRALAISIGLED